MTTTEDIALDAIGKEVSNRGAELVVDPSNRGDCMLWAKGPDSVDPVSERVSLTVSAGYIHATVFDPNGNKPTKYGGVTPYWVSITNGLDTNDQRVLAVVDRLVPEHQEKPADGTPCGDCGESIVDGEDPWEWSEDIGDFVHARCIDEPPHREGILTVGELKAALEDVPDHVHVCVTADGPDGAVINDGWWNNVADLVPPGDDGSGLGDQEGHFTFDLVVGGEFDTRQF